jgi:hypothetical protein
MGFTAKNLTKLQPKMRVFSTDYKSPTGAKIKMVFFKLNAEFLGVPLTGRAIRCNTFFAAGATQKKYFRYYP